VRFEGTMFCCAGGSNSTAKVNSQVEELLKAQAQADATKKDVKLLLLGTGESGKSTLFKQMKVLQDGGYSEEEASKFVYRVYGNVVTQMRVLLLAADKLKIAFADEANNERAKTVLATPAGGDAWSVSLAKDIKALWADAGLRKVFAMRNRKFHLNDSAAYFFDRIDAIMADDYIPSTDDILRVRTRTTGIKEARFEVNGISFALLDVGGQRGERRKWIQCFGDVTAVLYVVAISEYDQTLREDKQNRLLESLQLFSDINNSEWFENTPFILWLNKVDIFKEKITRLDPKDFCFPEYTGGKDYEAAKKYIRERFLERNTSQHALYSHFTSAVDTDNVGKVFRDITEIQLRDFLN